MLTFEDCVGLSGLTEEEIAAIAEHEHLPLLQAMEYGHYLIRQEDGALRIRKILADDLRHAEETGHWKHAEELRELLRQWIAHHLNSQKQASDDTAA